MTPQELKNSILQRAIQGRLVEQRPEEGTGEELYRKILAEKQRLVKEGKIKKEKPLPEITEDQKPFDIPENWTWVRLGFCSTYAQPKEKVSAEEIADNEWTLDLEDVEKETGNIIRICYKADRKIVGDKVRFHKGQILFSKLRPYLKKILVSPDKGICTPELVPFSMYANISHDYVSYYLKSPFVDYLINAATYGIKMPRAGTETMVNLPLPLPPLAEQRRIVAKIEELLPYVDRYAEAWNRLETFNERFPSDMRKSLLQLAIQGRLVEQHPDEGTGEELYREIQAEKRRKILAGEMKKEKPLPEISEDEIPFEIPKSWMWVRLGEVLVIERGGSPRPIKNYLTDGEDGVNWIKIGDTDKGGKYINGTKEKIIPAGVSKSRVVHKGDFLLSNSMSFGRPYILNIDGCIHDGWLVLRFIGMSFNPDYLYYLLSSPMVSRQFSRIVAGAVVNNLNSDKVARTLVPMPPFAEQQRTVAVLDKLLSKI